MLRVALGQMCSGMDAGENIARIAEMARTAQHEGARYLQVPEMAVLFAENRQQLAERALPMADNPQVRELSGLAKGHDIYLHIGSMAIALPDGRFANRSIVFAPDGSQAAQYDKIHLFDADVPGFPPYRESATYAPGDRAVTATLDMGTERMQIGLSVCYDCRFPRLYQDLVEEGAEVLAVPAAFTQPTGDAHWETLLRARAIETGSYVLAAAQAGAHANGRNTHGHSMIVNPWGEVEAVLDHREEGLLLGVIDPKKVADARARLPVLANRRPYSLSINDRGAH